MIRARSTVRASAVRVFVRAINLALTSAEHSNSGACLGISQTLYYKNVLMKLSTSWTHGFGEQRLRKCDDRFASFLRHKNYWRHGLPAPDNWNTADVGCLE